MRNLSWVLIAVAAVAFVIAVVTALTTFPLLNVKPQGFSNACNNLALLSIALMMACDKKGNAN